MTTDEIQKRIDGIAAGMLSKGLPQPNATILFKSCQEPSILLQWTSKNPYGSRNYFTGQIENALTEAEAYVAALPSPEQARMTAFMEALSEAIDLGKKADVEGEFVNPLMVLMKKISKNALQHQPAGSAA